MVQNTCPCGPEQFDPSYINTVLCHEYLSLCERLKSLQPARKRLCCLAIPKHFTPKYQSQPYEKSKIYTIYREESDRGRLSNLQHNTRSAVYRDDDVRTRTQQLALPQARKLLEMRKEFSHLFPPERMAVLNRTLRTTLLSAFGALANIRPPNLRPCYCKWSRKDWRKHAKAFGKLATPKKVFKAPAPVRLWKELKLMDRYKTLCLPKEHPVLEKGEWELTDAVKKYTPSDRIIRMSKPVDRSDFVHYQPLPIKITPEALSYKATKRIQQLATARHKTEEDTDLKENPFGVDPNALKAKASARIKDLAEPKEYFDKHTRLNPTAISPAALKAKASPRTIELAQPKKRD